MGFQDLDIFSTVRRYQRRYVLGLSLIALFALGAFAANQTMIQGQRSDGARINIAGRQRMLSQRTALFAAQVALGKSTQEQLTARVQLTRQADLLERSHQALLRGDPSMQLPEPKLDERAEALYFGQKKLDQKLSAYIEDLRTIASTDPHTTAFEEAFARNKEQAPVILGLLDEATKLYETQSRESTDQLAWLERVIVAFMLVTLVGEALFVFRPMDLKLRALLERIKRDGVTLEAAMKRLELILDAGGDAIVTLSPGGELGRMHSQRFEKWFGTCQQGEDALAIIFGHDALLLRRLRELFSQLDATASNLGALLPDLPTTLARKGKHYSLHWRILDGEKPQLVLIARDVSSVHSVLEAREASRARSIFLANIAHEFRTPLTAILGYTELLQEEYPEHDLLNEDLESILLAATQLLLLVNEILDLSKVEVGQMEVHPTTFDFEELAMEVKRMLKPSLGSQKNSIRLEVDEDLDEIFSDRDKVRQVLLNLLSNANKFTTEDELILRAATALDGHRAMLVVEVEDHGEGMDEETQRLIFRAFSQGVNALENRHKGTGLGLTITRQFAHLLGGKVELESTPGEGSTFRIMIPVVWTLEQSEDLMHSPTEEEELEEGIHAQIVSMRLN